MTSSQLDDKVLACLVIHVRAVARGTTRRRSPPKRPAQKTSKRTMTKTDKRTASPAGKRTVRKTTTRRVRGVR